MKITNGMIKNKNMKKLTHAAAAVGSRRNYEEDGYGYFYTPSTNKYIPGRCR